MCGLAGILRYGSDEPVDRPELIAIRDHMRPRGPDGAGIWIDDKRHIGLAHQRLAVIDLRAAAAQPMASTDYRLYIVFNGEIYNYLELTEQLTGLGHVLVTRSDTEVVLCAYRQWGHAMVNRLRGMFAFSIWDVEKQELFLARDHFGIKPLYYFDDGTTFRYASQVKALLAGNAIPDRLEPAGLVGFYLWGCLPEPFTLTKNLRSLPAGHTLCVDADGMHAPRPFFDLRSDLIAGGDSSPLSEEQVEERLRQAVTDSVRKHLIADVPVCVFLSAGIDSSTIAALAMQEWSAGGIRNPQESLTAVTLGVAEYADTDQDEVPLARHTAQQYGLHHQAPVISKGDFDSDLPALLAAMDLPTIDGVNSWFVARAAARAGFKVALSGLGADELLGGYPTFAHVPAIVQRTQIAASIPGFGRSFRWLSAALIAKYTSPKYAGLFEYGGTYGGAYLLRRALFMPWELPRLMDPEIVKQGWADLQPVLRADEWLRPVSGTRARVVSLELQMYMRNMLLRDSDWTSMAHSLEVRVPLVDIELYRSMAPCVSGKYPPSKSMLARAPRNGLSQALQQRAKKGFSVPTARWIGSHGGNGRGLRDWARLVICGPSNRNVSSALWPLSRWRRPRAALR
jgi:asparagine synthase (glutamine-hydrolysing)